MALTIVSKPALINFCGNLPDFVLTSVDPVDFKLYQGLNLILEEKYFPDASGEIRIDLEDVVDGLLSLQVPDLNVPVFSQSLGCLQFKAVIDTTEELFKVVKGGVNTPSIDTAAFLVNNFLTWQPQSKTVSLTDPQWLSYYADAECKMVAKAYLVDSTVQILDVATLPAGILTTVNVTYQQLAALFSSQPYSIDLWVSSAGIVRSYIQRFSLGSEVPEFSDLFVFANSLGGIDSVSFTGQIQHNDNFVFTRGLFDDMTRDFNVDADQAFTKETGFFKTDGERIWSLEFFKSLQKYHLAAGVLKNVILPKQTLESVPGDLNGYSFTFAYGKQTRYLQLSRTVLPEVINEHTKIYYGYAASVPVTAVDVKALPFSKADTAMEIVLPTGLNRIAVICLPPGKLIDSVKDLQSNETLTLSYKLIRTVEVDGVELQVIVLRNAVAYTYNHEHFFILKNG